MLTKQQPIIHELTEDEQIWVLRLYKAPSKDYPLELNQIQYMPDKDVFMLCYWYDNTFFQGTRPNEWKITRDNIKIEVYHKPKGVKYIIDVQDGDVFIDKKGLRSNLGTAAYAFQFHMKHHYAFPLFFCKGHWANGKNALQLGIAVPNRQPLTEALLEFFDNNEQLVNDWLSDKLFHGILLNNVEVFNQELTEIKKQLTVKG